MENKAQHLQDSNVTYQSNNLDPYIENVLELKKFLIKPTAQDLFPEITKDLALSNLNPYDITKITYELEVVNMLLLWPDLFPQSIKSYLRDILSTLQVNRSKFGWLGRLGQTQISEQTADHKITELDAKRKAIFQMNRQGGQ
jgi:hypothetical protein